MARMPQESDEFASANPNAELPPLPWGLNWARDRVSAGGLTIWKVIKRGNVKWEPEPAPEIQHPLKGVNMTASEVERGHGMLTTDKHSRKLTPVFSGFLRYFPRATAAVAALSQIGNEQHNPGTPLHWDRSKSGDERDALVRHLLEAGTYDTDGVRHSTKVAWRAMAALEKELEADDRSDPRPGDTPADHSRSGSWGGPDTSRSTYTIRGPGSEDSGPGY